MAPTSCCCRSLYSVTLLCSCASTASCHTSSPCTSSRSRGLQGSPLPSRPPSSVTLCSSVPLPRQSLRSQLTPALGLCPPRWLLYSQTPLLTTQLYCRCPRGHRVPPSQSYSGSLYSVNCCFIFYSSLLPITLCWHISSMSSNLANLLSASP